VTQKHIVRIGTQESEISQSDLKIRGYRNDFLTICLN